MPNGNVDHLDGNGGCGHDLRRASRNRRGSERGGRGGGGGLQRRLAALLSPLLGRIYPTAARDPETMESLCGNATANLLGLGNAATPLGIAAVRRMQALSGGRAATDEACRLIVMNTASIQLLPTTVAALRAGLGSASPFAILPAVWATSLLSVSAGLLAARVLQKWL